MRHPGFHCTLSFLFIAGYLFGSEPVYSHLTKTQSLYIIDTICKSPYRSYEINYNGDRVYLKSVHVDYKLYYDEYYFPSGILMKKGLRENDHDKRGTWLYYNTKGELYKEFNFSTNIRILYGINHEKFDWVIDSVSRMTKRIAEERLGKDFCTKHVRFDPYILWGTHSSEDFYGEKYPDMPAERPYYTQVRFTIIYKDSIEMSDYTFCYDSLFNLKWISGCDKPELFRRKDFIVDYDSACRFKSDGYSSPELIWNDDFKEFCWKFYKCPPEQNIWDENNDCTEKEIYASTGESVPFMIKNFVTDRSSSGFKVLCEDTIHTKQGWKEQGFAGASFRVPMNWIPTEIDKRIYPKTNFITSGPDTLWGSSECGRFLKCYLSKTIFDTASMNNFNSTFPGKNIQSRDFEFKCIQDKNGKYELSLMLLEPINAMDCGEITYYYHAEGLNAAQRDEMIAILKTIRFAFCLPSKK